MGRVYAVEPPFGSTLDPNDEGRMIADAVNARPLRRISPAVRAAYVMPPAASPRRLPHRPVAAS
jgi:hypothetical protein